MHSKCDFRLV